MRRRTNQKPAAFDVTRGVAIVLLGVLVLLGLVVVAVPVLFQMRAVRQRIEQLTASLVKDETNLDVSLRIDRPLWPPGVVVKDVVVGGDSKARPFATLREARVTLRPFSLLSGKVALSSIELEGLDVDVDLVDGQPKNLPLKLKPHPPKPKELTNEPPFRLLAVTAARVRANVKNGTAPAISFDVNGIDLDVDVDALGDGTPRFDVRLQKAAGVLHTPRVSRLPAVPPERFDHDAPKLTAPRDVVDDDALCGLSASVVVTDGADRLDVDLRKLEVEVRLDDFDDPGSEPTCSGAPANDRLVALRLDRISARIPKESSKRPQLLMGPPMAKVRFRAPAALAARYVELPPVAGWALIDLDVMAMLDFDDPMAGVMKASVDGRLEGADLRFDQFRMGSALNGELSLRPPLVVGAKKISVAYGDGNVTLSNVEVKLAPTPLAKQHFPMRAAVDVAGVTFPGLIRELGVARKAHVRWDIDKASAKIAGFLDPLSLDGDLTAKTKGFELTGGPVENPSSPHVIGVSPSLDGGVANIATRVQVRPAGLTFDNILATFGSTVLRGRTTIGFHDTLEVDAVADPIDLTDISPLARFPIAGKGKAKVQIAGPINDPDGTGTASFEGFVFDVFPLGKINETQVHFRGQVIELSGLAGSYGEPNDKDYHAVSQYRVPSMRIDLGPKNGGSVVLDALVSADFFKLDDFYEVFKMRDDPRWKEIQGSLGFDASIHMAAGGPEDPCGSGRLMIDGRAKNFSLDLFGERFDAGSADVALDWVDLGASGLGLDVDLRAATLRKKGGGTVMASGRVDRGGRMSIEVTASALNAGAIAALPALSLPLECRIDATAKVGGTFDTMTIDADVHAGPLRIGGQSLPSSRVHVRRSPLPGLADTPAPDARGCYRGRKFPPFDLARWQSDPIEGEYSMSGELFGSTISFEDLRVTDARKRVARGKIALRGVDVGALSKMRPMPASSELEPGAPKPAEPMLIAGRASADVTLESWPVSAWWTSRGKIENLKLDVHRDDIGVATDDRGAPSIKFSPEGIDVAETKLLLALGTARTSLLIEGKIDNSKEARAANASPLVRGRIELPALPLSKLTDFTPRLERADGTARATLRLAGTLDAPTWDGQLGIAGGAFTVKGLGIPITGVNGVIDIDPRTGVKITKLHGEVGGGSVDVSGGARLEGFGLGDVDVKIAAREVHVKYGEGISATVDADLRTTWSPPEKGSEPEPFRVTGAVEVDSFLYEKEVKVFDVGSFQQAKRTEVDTYDPANDKVMLDIDVRAKSGLRIRNGLVDASVTIGKKGLRVSGTNQRFGIIGQMSVAPGGIFKIRQQQFDIREGTLSFDDETKIDPQIDLVAYSDYRRAASAQTSAEWRIRLHAYGTTSDLKLELTSDPALSQDDILALLTLGMTRSELAQLGTQVPGLGLLSEALGVSQTLKQAIPVIDDFAFGQAYSIKTGRSEPNVTLGKRITDAVRASITTSIAEQDREVFAGIEWRLSRSTSLRGSYDNVNDVTSSSVGNIGIDLRWRIEFK